MLRIDGKPVIRVVIDCTVEGTVAGPDEQAVVADGEQYLVRYFESKGATLSADSVGYVQTHSVHAVPADQAARVFTAAMGLLTRIDHMTSHEFACGGEKAEREALRAALGLEEYTDAPAPARTLPDGVTWCFAVMANEPGRLVVFLSDAPEGNGEFSIKWLAVGGDTVPHLEVFADGWKTFAYSGLVWALLDWPQDITIAQAVTALEHLGFTNRTAPAEGD